MKGYAFAARSPLEVGDTVLTADGERRTVTDILTVHSAANEGVWFVYQLDCSLNVRLDDIACRLVDGRATGIGEEVGVLNGKIV